MNTKTVLQRVAGVLAESPLLHRGRSLWEANSKEWTLPLSKLGKLLCGGYIILRDYADGRFPPRFHDQAEAYRNEVAYGSSLPGHSLVDWQKISVTKPFWSAGTVRYYLTSFNRVYEILENHGLKAGSRLLELGCGSGWMAELLALGGYSVMGTTISPLEVTLGNQKVAALKCKEQEGQFTFQLEFRECPMEAVDEIPGAPGSFDGAFVFEALHHAFDWRKTLHATARILKPGGWLLVANEPNRIHTCVSYRVARLTKTHEIGFSKKELVRELAAASFSEIHVISPVIDNGISPLWIMARRTGDR